MINYYYRGVRTMSQTTFIRVNDDARKQLKVLAANEDVTMIKMLEILIQKYKEVNSVSTDKAND